MWVGCAPPWLVELELVEGDAEHRIYVYGDDPGTHAAALAAPGLVVLRRRDQQPLFQALWHDDPQRYAERMTAWYGEPGGWVAHNGLEPGPEFPLWEEALAGAEALVLLDGARDLDVGEHWSGPLVRGADAQALVAALRAGARERPFNALAHRVAGELAELGIDPRFPVVDRVGDDIGRYLDAL